MTQLYICHCGPTHYSYDDANKVAGNLASIGRQHELQFVIHENLPAATLISNFRAGLHGQA